MFPQLTIILFSLIFSALADDVDPNRERKCAELTEVRSQQGKPTMKNIGFLGSGYDIIFANPHPTQSKTGIDPGYRRHIFDLTKYCGDVTADHRHQIPENVTVLKHVSGKLQFNVEVINTTKSFTKTLSKSYQMDFGSTIGSNQSATSNSGWVGKLVGEGLGTVGNVLASVHPAVGPIASGLSKLLGNFGTVSIDSTDINTGLAFSASRDHRHVTEELRTRFTRFVETSATCTVYKASLNSYAAPSMTINFRAAAETLPAFDIEEIDVADERYVQFFNEYGTHVITSVLMGASYGERYSIDENSWSKIEARNVDWKVAASRATRENICKIQKQNSGSEEASNCKSTGSNIDPSGKTGNDGKDADTFSKLFSERSVFTVGSLPPANLEAESWINQSFDNPVPVHLTLDLVVNLLTKKYFPADELIAKRRAGLLKALAKYCEVTLNPNGHVKSCDLIREHTAPFNDFTCKKLGESAVEGIAKTVATKTGLPSHEIYVLPVSFNDKYFVILKEKVTRVKGNEPCRRITKGMTKLVNMERESEFKCVANALLSLNGNKIDNQRQFWVGMTRDFGSTFAWENGAPFSYTTRWAKNEPNNKTSWSRYRNKIQVSSEDFVMLSDEYAMGVANGYHFNDIADVADWPSPLCEGHLHRLELPENLLSQANPAAKYGKSILIRNQRFMLPLRGPRHGSWIGGSSFNLASVPGEELARSQLQGPWVVEQRSWFWSQKWTKQPQDGGQIHYGDIVQILNGDGSLALDSEGDFQYYSSESSWRSVSDVFWRVKECFPADSDDNSPVHNLVNMKDCVYFENYYYPGCYLNAAKSLLSSSYFIACSHSVNEKQLWIIDELK